MCIYNIYVYIHHVPKDMSCNKAIVAITGRLHCFRDCIYIYIYVYIHDMIFLYNLYQKECSI